MEIFYAKSYYLGFLFLFQKSSMNYFRLKYQVHIIFFQNFEISFLIRNMTCNILITYKIKANLAVWNLRISRFLIWTSNNFILTFHDLMKWNYFSRPEYLAPICLSYSLRKSEVNKQLTRNKQRIKCSHFVYLYHRLIGKPEDITVTFQTKTCRYRIWSRNIKRNFWTRTKRYATKFCIVWGFCG